MMTKTVERKAEKEQKKQGRKLPDGWCWVKLGDISRLASGGTPHRGNSANFVGDIPWVKTLDLNCNIVYETEERISLDAFDNINGEILPIGTVMVAMYGGGGTIGKSGILGLEATTNQAICSILPNPDIFIPEFLHAWLLLIRPQWMSYSQGNRRDPNINKGIVSNMQIPLPPLEEQRRIVGILRDRMSAIEKARLATEAQLEAAQALPTAYLCQIFDSPEAQKWETKLLGDCLTNIQAGKSVNCVEIPANLDEWGVLKVSAVSWQKFDPEANKVLPLDFVPSPELEVKTGDLLISRANTTELVGAVVLVRETRPRLMLSDKTLRLDTIPQKVAKEYLEIVLRERQARAFIEENATGTSDSMKNISQKLICKIPVLLPPLEVQKRIAHDIRNREPNIEKTCQSLQDQLDTINALPAALLRQAFNGEL